MSDKASKTEQPTPKRKKEAQQEGRIARTPELTAWVSMLVVTWMAPSVMHNITAFFHKLLARVEAAASRPDENTAMKLFGYGVGHGLLTIAPLVAVIMLVGVVGNVAQVGIKPKYKVLKPKFSKVNPLLGLKRLFSPHSMWEAAKNLIKLAVVGLLGYQMLAGMVPKLIDAGQPSLRVVIASTAAKSIAFTRTAAAIGLAIAGADYALQRRRILQGMKMSKEEVKQEARQAEGDPHVKGAIRSKQRAMSRLRMMAAVAKADVVIVNPIHVAVALRYEAAKGAPRVVAKGAGEVAARIREEADKHGVPIVENIPLARTLHRVCELDDEVPVALYEAVARILAFVFALRTKGRAAGRHHVPGVVVPDVPDQRALRRARVA